MALRTGGLVIGWREWVHLSDLGITVKAKIDTGARTSAIHATDIAVSGDDGNGHPTQVTFQVHPHHTDDDDPVEVTLPLLDIREIRSSNGEVQERYVVKTWARLHRRRWQIELTLASREDMGFRMLLGRTAVRGRFLVDPAASYVAGDLPS